LLQKPNTAGGVARPVKGLSSEFPHSYFAKTAHQVGAPGVIPSEAVLQAQRGISRALPEDLCLHARFLAPLVKARGFGMTTKWKIQAETPPVGFSPLALGGKSRTIFMGLECG